MNIISRQEAIAHGMKYYFTGKSCVHGHVSKRISRNAFCYECGKQTTRDSNKRHRSQRNEYQNTRKLNPKARAKHNETNREYQKDNLWRFRGYAAKRKAAKLHATPAWANRDAIQAVYEACERIQTETGIPHNVDHIVPLQGDMVCGLHVEGNLQILTERENLKKGNQLTSSP